MSGRYSPPNTPPSHNVTQFHLDQQQQPTTIFGNTVAMEEISNQLQDMCVDDINNVNNNNNTMESSDNLSEQQYNADITTDCLMDSSEDYNHRNHVAQLTSSDISSSLMTDDDDDDCPVHVANLSSQEESSSILVVTNINSRLFSDENLKQQFESSFIAFDPNVTFRYLKSFRRVRLDFSTAEQAEAARHDYNNFNIDAASKCYAVQLIKSNQGSNSSHLLPPKPTRQFLISPPASPPVGWEPVTENSPCINVQLLSAIANLVPGKAHMIHEATESQPGIVVEVCDDLRMQPDRFEETKPIKQVTRIAPTARPF